MEQLLNKNDTIGKTIKGYSITRNILAIIYIDDTFSAVQAWCNYHTHKIAEEVVFCDTLLNIEILYELGFVSIEEYTQYISNQETVKREYLKKSEIDKAVIIYQKYGADVIEAMKNDNPDLLKTYLS